MNWQFRRSFKVIPGVRLNLSQTGLSISVGDAPATLNFGPRGVYGTVSLSGTGLSYRRHIDGLVVTPASANTPDCRPYEFSVVTEIRSASTYTLHSSNLNHVRELLNQVYDERSALKSEISVAEYEAKKAAERYHAWEDGLLFRHIFKRSFAARREQHETAAAKVQELHEQLRLTKLATQIEIEPARAEPYYRMCDEFSALCDCRRVWDKLNRRAVNRVVERSAAAEVITRADVSLSLDECDLIEWHRKVPHFPNKNGGDLYIYPGFVLYRASHQAFALIDCREVNLHFSTVRFIEDGPLPADSSIVGTVWAKSNKDGSPDRRFRDNYQIPLVLYGVLEFTSASGLHEVYQVSNPELAKRFHAAWDQFVQSFTAVRRTFADSKLSNVLRPGQNRF